jgi:hypothetical protein
MKALPHATAIAPIQHGIMIGKLNAHRLADRPGVHVGGHLLGEIALHVVADAAGELHDFQPAPDLALGIVEGLAVLERHQARQIVGALVHQPLEVEHHTLAAQRRRRGPRKLRLLGDLDGLVDLGLRGEGHLGSDLAGRGIGHVAGASGLAGHVLVGNEVRDIGDHVFLRRIGRVLASASNLRKRQSVV